MIRNLLTSLLLAPMIERAIADHRKALNDFASVPLEDAFIVTIDNLPAKFKMRKTGENETHVVIEISEPKPCAPWNAPRFNWERANQIADDLRAVLARQGGDPTAIEVEHVRDFIAHKLTEGEVSLAKVKSMEPGAKCPGCGQVHGDEDAEAADGPTATTSGDQNVRELDDMPDGVRAFVVDLSNLLRGGGGNGNDGGGTRH